MTPTLPTRRCPKCRADLLLKKITGDKYGETLKYQCLACDGIFYFNAESGAEDCPPTAEELIGRHFMRPAT